MKAAQAPVGSPWGTRADAVSPYPPSARQPRLEFGLMAALFLAALAISAIYAYYMIFSVFATYDDEGFILISLKFFFQGHALYDEVFSIYQPFFHVFNWIVFGLTGSRSVTTASGSLPLPSGCWGCAEFLHYLPTHLKRPLALAVLIVSVPWLYRFIWEPGHPQVLAYVLVAAIVALIATMDRLPRTAFGLSTGLLVGLLLMTKINVGVTPCCGGPGVCRSNAR